MDESTGVATQPFRARLGLFAVLTLCGFVIFALTMTFVPAMPVWINYVARTGLLVVFAGLWGVARGGNRLSPFRPVFFAYFAVVFSLTLSFFLGDFGLRLFGMTTDTPRGIAVAKFSQAFVTVIGVLTLTRLCGESLASLYIRKGRLMLGVGLGFIGAAACSILALRQPATTAVGGAQLIPLLPWILLFVVSNGVNGGTCLPWIVSWEIPATSGREAGNSFDRVCLYLGSHAGELRA